MEETKLRRRADIGIYKANTKKTGSVAQFKMSHKNDCLFLELAPQIREMKDSKPYDWENKIVVKLGISDITKMMAYFRPQILYTRNPPQPLKLFHQSKSGTKGIELKWQAKYNNYYLSVSSKTGTDDPKRVSVPIGLDEVELLMVAFTRGLEIILAW